MAGIPYYTVVPCCPAQGTALTYFNLPPESIQIKNGVFVYNNPVPVTTNGITFTMGQCYTINYAGAVFVDYPQTPPISDFSNAVNCENIEICETCEKLVQCYTLFPCQPDLPVLVSDSETLAGAVGAFATLFGYPGCYYVSANAPGDCVGAQDIRWNAEIPCACVLNCYSITGNPVSVTYVNESGELITTSGSTRICSLITPVVVGGAQGVVYNFGPCVEGICPEVCFKFTNCQTQETLIVTNTTTVLGYFANNNVVTLQGYDGCWTIDISNEPCDCAVNVTILQVFDDCPTCLPVIAYKFTNCNNQSIIKYSTDDYSIYVGKTVKLDCGDCWFVDLINYMPPATQTISLVTTFESCLACSRTYYQLTDCSGVDNTIYTFTDLSNLVGKVIKIEACSTCWEVSILDNPTLDQSTIASPVTLVSSYDDCNTCGAQLACRCSIAWPTETGELSYVDCNGQAFAFRGLDPNTPTEKLCIREWILAREPIYYGDCEITDFIACITYMVIIPPLFETQTLFYKDCDGIVQQNNFPISKAPVQYFICGIAGQTSADIYLSGGARVEILEQSICERRSIFSCPAPIYPKRFIKPGYHVPTCDIEKYEKISCNAAEILYKMVLTARYGISNCCEASDDKWLTKKELIDLQAAMDPNIVCTPVQSCCNNTPTCGCGCNVTPQSTCNSR